MKSESEAKALLDELHSRGCKVRPEGGDLLIRGHLEPEDIKRIRERKPELLELLAWGTHRTVAAGGSKWLTVEYPGRTVAHRMTEPMESSDELDGFLLALLGGGDGEHALRTSMSLGSGTGPPELK